VVMAGWNPGAVFGVCWMVFFVPISVVGTIWFWARRDIQPIKARQPVLVVVTDIVLILYVVLLCFQRILSDNYPCLLTLWSGYIGTLVLFNTYLWRCWTLYFKFHLTQQKLLQGKVDMQNLPFFIRNKHYISTLFLLKVAGTSLIILCLPPGILTSVFDLSSEFGDGCDRKWGDLLLALYVVLYVLVFAWFGWSLRQVVDGFKIKTELKITSIIGILAVIPWVVFNNLLTNLNENTFPFSTLFLIIAAVTAYCTSTLWPLYSSIFQSAALNDLDVPANVSTLRGLLQTAQGFEAFKAFLSKEFSVENILFYQEVVDFRKMKQELKDDPDSDLKLLQRAQAIYAKFIIIDAPFQVNLPDLIVRKLEIGLKNEFAQAGKKREQKESTAVTITADAGSDAAAMQEEQLACPTIFDAAQTNIFNLMNTDSFPRYARTEEYKAFVKDINQKSKTKDILKEQGIL